MKPNLLNSLVHVTESPPNVEVHLLSPKELCRELSGIISDAPVPRVRRHQKLTPWRHEY